MQGVWDGGIHYEKYPVACRIEFCLIHDDEILCFSFYRIELRQYQKGGWKIYIQEYGEGEMLVDKFITEYFYVVPDVNNINTRISGTAGLARLVSPELFAQWTATIAPEISDMAAAGMMRTARVIEINMPEIGDRWQITYELHTWTVPNDLSLTPIITRGTMMVKMRYEPGFWKDTSGKEINIGHELETGRDPSTIFKFRVFEIENME